MKTIKPRIISAFYFRAWTGIEPIEDDLTRCNCNQIGQEGHDCCGWCEKHNKPQFMCMCKLKTKYKLFQ